MQPSPESTQSARHSLTWWRTFRNVALFSSLYVLTCGALGLLIPFPEVPTISSKWAYFLQHRDEFDTIFVGSSRVYHQIIPSQFDAALAKAGAPLRSFNFGQDAMWPPESLYTLRKILSLPLPRLKWVFIEHMEMQTGGKFMHFAGHTAQLTYWHDSYHTWLSVRDVAANSAPAWDKVKTIWRHLDLWFGRATHLGEGASWLAQTSLLDLSGKKAEPTWELATGYQPLIKNTLTAVELGQFKRHLNQSRKGTADHQTRPLLKHEWRDIAQRVRAKGAQPIFFTSPSVHLNEDGNDPPEGATLLSFNLPLSYPELYQPENFSNLGHLNSRGAVLYTDIFAASFIGHLRSTGALPSP